MFAVGLAVGNIANSDLVGRQLTANAAPAAPTTINTQLAVGMHPAEVLRVLDGDTFEARVRVWPGLDITTKIRLRSIDAPELKAHCADERSLAESSCAHALKMMLAEGGVAVSHVGLDKYGGRVRVTRNLCHAGYRNRHARQGLGARLWRRPPRILVQRNLRRRRAAGFSPRMDCAKTQPLAA